MKNQKTKQHFSKRGKPWIPIENSVFQIKKFEILDFSHSEFEILGISSKIPGTSKILNFN